MAEIRLKARAKINLTLDVLQRLNSGYHQVEMILQQIDLSDEVGIVSDGQKGCIRVESNCSTLPKDGDNIAYGAAQLIKDMYGIKQQATITLQKSIPVAAGLGGGSADAAAVILGLNRIWGLGLDIPAMMKLGTRLGADVPFCILGGTALARGIGEVLTPIPSDLSLDILLVKPDLMVSTASVYKSLDITSISKRPDNYGMIEALKAGDNEGIADRMFNVLEGVTVKRHPEIGIIKKDMMVRGALGAIMSGSGPTVAGLYENQQGALAAAEFFKTKYKEVIVTKTVTLEEGE
jgi:4-diphosphocytidyl-2-C-methyl-D-erythritol kinase